MMEEAEKKIIRECFNNILKNFPNFKSRAMQRKMIAEIASTFSCVPKNEDEKKSLTKGEAFLVIEGPTGTGKSLAYLLPAIVMAKAKDKYLVVSSATITLQEQLANKDIPILTKYGKLDVTYAIAKGRGRYACTYRLQQYSGFSMQEEMPLQNDNEEFVWDHKPSPEEISLFKKMAEQLKKRQWNGDRDTFSDAIPENQWQRITNDRHSCLKQSCAFYNECPFFNARRSLEEVDVIIVNHDLLLADLSMGGGIILPPPQETFYCIDEAHNLTEKAVKQFAASHHLFGTLTWLEKINSVTLRASNLLKSDITPRRIAELADVIAQTLRDLSITLGSVPQLNPPLVSNTFAPPMLRFQHGRLSENFLIYCHNLTATSKDLLLALTALQDGLKKAKNIDDNTLFDKALSDIGFFINRAENLYQVWSLLATEPPIEQPPIAKWITAQKSKQGVLEYTFSASPVRAAKLLIEKFWRHAMGAILTSATLRSLNSFEMLLVETGLKNFPTTKCLALSSPFDFAKQGKLIIPTMKSDPTNAAAHTQEIIQLLPKFLPITGGNGTLVLFSSKKQMQEVIQNLPQEIVKLILVQNEKPKTVLLNEHFARIANNQPSILFGLASFAEGLDLPGNACNHLILAKLPFAVPDEPVSEALAEWIAMRGGNPFFEITLPAAAIKLIQAVGRLIRSERDTGTVVIFDNRLEKKSYGQLIKKSLPPFQQVLD